jgi:predicted double-glycine peptidase
MVAMTLTVVAHADTLDLSGMGFGSFAMKVTSLKEARFKATLRQQYDFSCGSAALATLLSHHYGQPASEQMIFEEMFASGDQEKIRKQGFSLLDMKNFLKKRGFDADGFELPLATLQKSGLPAIVLVSDKGYQHFVVIKGLRDGRILLGDPAGGSRALSIAAFEALWSNKVLFVIHNRRDKAQFNLAADWQVNPRAPLSQGVNLEGLGFLALTKFGPGDF